jgi:predicted 3-demethylubiquinone-9 3-methyltransferase (glyoxalase superfamily)
MQTLRQKITPFLWFDTQAEEAAKHYVSIFKNSKIDAVSRYGEGMPLPAGTAMTVGFELDGQKFTALNGGPTFKFTEAVSFVVDCADQAEVDYYWGRLLEGGGKESQCGWLKDKFGLSWQIVPRRLVELGSDPDKVKAGRVMQAMMGMVKIDVAALERAYRGEA